MRSDSEIKAKILELLEIQGAARNEQMQALDKLDTAALKQVKCPHHSTRGMVSALYWVLGYEFKDIHELFVQGSVDSSDDSAEDGEDGEDI